MRHRFAWPLAALLLLPAAGAAQERVLTLEEALSLARQRGVSAILARGRVEEARIRGLRAGRRFQENPVVEIGGGPRRAEEDDFFDYEVGVSQGFEPGARRTARVAGAEAAVERTQAELAEAERQLLREAGEAFLRAVAAEDRRAFLAHSRQAAEGLLAGTERRYEAGEATAIELNRSRIAAAAARAEERAAEAMRAAALAGLQALLGIPPGEDVSIRGSLAPRPLPDMEALLRDLDRRPDLAALAAELREAEAEVLLGQALARPAWGLRGGYEREEGADAVTAGIAVSLPWHDRGQETLALGQARAEALRGALAVARQGAEAEVRRTAEALARQAEAAQELERTALPALDDNESLAEKSFEAGEIDLGELLMIRREILETRLLYADRLLDAALARLDLETAAGALR